MAMLFSLLALMRASGFFRGDEIEWVSMIILDEIEHPVFLGRFPARNLFRARAYWSSLSRLTEIKFGFGLRKNKDRKRGSALVKTACLPSNNQE